MFNKKTAIICLFNNIYTKIRILHIACSNIILVSLKEILAEAKYNNNNIKVIKVSKHKLKNDDKIIQAAHGNNYCVISKDKKLLKKIRKINLPYYNSLMVRNSNKMKKYSKKIIKPSRIQWDKIYNL